MAIFCEIILDLEYDLSRMKEVSEKISGQMEYASEILIHKGIILIHLNW